MAASRVLSVKLAADVHELVSQLGFGRKALAELGAQAEKTDGVLQERAAKSVASAVKQRQALEALAGTYLKMAQDAERGSNEQVAAADLAARAQKRLAASVDVASVAHAKHARELRNVQSELGKTERGVLSASGAFSGFGRSIAFASGTFLGAAGFTEVVKQSISAASDLHEEINKSQVVFGKSANSVLEWSKKSATAFGQSRSEALAAASSFGNMLVPLGVAPAKAAAMSRSLVQLAGDMASFNNASPEDTLKAVQSGLAGQVRPLREYGVQLSATRIAAEAMSEGLVHADVDMGKVEVATRSVDIAQAKLLETQKKYPANSTQVAQAQNTLEAAQQRLTKAMGGHIPVLDAEQKMLASYGIILKDTKIQQGDFTRTSGGLANQQRILSANIKNTEEAVGTALLPVVLKATTAVNDWLGKSENQEKVQRALNDVVRAGKLVVEDAWPVVKTMAHWANEVANGLGGWKSAIELATAATVFTRLTRLASAFGMSKGGVASEASLAGDKVGALAAALKKLPRNVAIAIAITGATDLYNMFHGANASGHSKAYDALHDINPKTGKQGALGQFINLITGGAFNGGRPSEQPGQINHLGDGTWERIAPNGDSIVIPPPSPGTPYHDYTGGRPGTVRTMPGASTGASGISGRHTVTAIHGTAGREDAGYVSPIGAGLSTGRVDQGVDYSGTGDLRTIGKATFVVVKGQNSGTGWPGAGGAGTGAMIVYRLEDGPRRGQYVYSAENIDPLSGIRPGLTVQAGTPFARSRGAYPYLETGFSDASGTPLDHATYREGVATAHGQQFLSLVSSLPSGGGGSAIAAVGGAASSKGKASLTVAGGKSPSAKKTLDALLAAQGFDLTEAKTRANPANVTGLIKVLSSEAAFVKQHLNAGDLSHDDQVAAWDKIASLNEEISSLESQLAAKAKAQEDKRKAALKKAAEAKKKADDARKKAAQALQRAVEQGEKATPDVADSLLAGTNIDPSLLRGLTPSKYASDIAAMNAANVAAQKAAAKILLAKHRAASEALAPYALSEGAGFGLLPDIGQQFKKLADQAAQATKRAVQAASQALTASKSDFENAWGKLASAGLAAFDKETQNHLQKMKVNVTGNFQTFLFGDDITQTPTEQAIKDLQDSHDTLARQTAIQDDKDALAKAQTDDEKKQAQKQLDDDLYADKIATMQKQADAERVAADKQLQDAQNSYQDQRDLQRQTLQDQLDDMEKQLEKGGTSTDLAMQGIRGVFAQFGIDLDPTSGDLGQPIIANLDDLISKVGDRVGAINTAVGNLATANGQPAPKQTGGTSGTPGVVTLSNGETVPNIAAISAQLAQVGGLFGFADGGIVRGGRGGVLGVIGEGIHDEAIIPLPKGANSLGSRDVHVHVDMRGAVVLEDDRGLARRLARIVKPELARIVGI